MTTPESSATQAATPASEPAAPSASGTPPQKVRGDSSAKTESAAGFVKLDTRKLDSLVDLVGELVIAQSMVVQDPEVQRLSSRHLARTLRQLGRITTELQRTAMSLRMVPIRRTFQKMTRLVRDLAEQQDKQVQLITEGEETELDRNIVEELSDPLVHMIRNAVDHGIESAADRISQGKPAVGTIRLSASHQRGGIVISIQDDGKGLDRERILAKAGERGLKAGSVWLTHCPGVVAMGRNEDPDSSRTDFYIVIGQAPRYLDRNLNVFGRVLAGMSVVQRIVRGPESNAGVFLDDTTATRIRSIKLLSEIPGNERESVFVMDTSSKAFAELLDGRRKREQSFFKHRPPPVLDVCQVPVGARLTKYYGTGPHQ